MTLLFLLSLMWYWEKAMAPYSRTLAWEISWTEEPGRLQSMGSLSRTRLSDFTFTFHFHALCSPVFLPAESQGWGSLVGCCLWGRTELDTSRSDLAAGAAACGIVLRNCSLKKIIVSDN